MIDLIWRETCDTVTKFTVEAEKKCNLVYAWKNKYFYERLSKACFIKGNMSVRAPFSDQ